MIFNRLKYVATVPEFEAIQFQGGRESASYLADLLADHEIHSAWYDALPEVVIEPADDAAEGTTPTVIDAQPERFVVELEQGSLEGRIGNWIVIDQDHKPYLYTDAQFRSFYTEKRGD